ncbi:hypothetical protein P43SY_011882 [Pythium insidiosum]|uniref:SAC3/GANP/THP3 conserved domain-containing protein n=1 Tax=Pythium insidiosum TaxID=114742 RepID=A0AAD5LQR7_PYTIN|nr:hypothetical protein P43SY_011882 [Pythium insidiosum]
MTQRDQRQWRRGHRRHGDGPSEQVGASSPSPSACFDSAPVIGVCASMCPEQERKERERERDVSRFEISSSSASWMVKKYRRPAAGRDDLDPRVTLQRLDGADRIQALEEIARFHILASHVAALHLPRQSTLDWSETLNNQQLASALTELHALYRSVGATSGHPEEMLALDLLLHLRDPSSVSLLMRQTAPTVLRSRCVQDALAAFVACQTRDFYGFGVVLRRLPALQQSLAARHMPFVAGFALRMMNKAYTKIDRFALDEVASIIGTAGADDAERLCQSLMVHVEKADASSSVPDTWEAERLVASVRFKVSPVLQDDVPSDVEVELLKSYARRLHEHAILKCGLSARDLVMPTATGRDK